MADFKIVGDSEVRDAVRGINQVDKKLGELGDSADFVSKRVAGFSQRVEQSTNKTERAIRTSQRWRVATDRAAQAQSKLTNKLAGAVGNVTAMAALLGGATLLKGIANLTAMGLETLGATKELERLKASASDAQKVVGVTLAKAYLSASKASRALSASALDTAKAMKAEGASVRDTQRELKGYSNQARQAAIATANLADEVVVASNKITASQVQQGTKGLFNLLDPERDGIDVRAQARRLMAAYQEGLISEANEVAEAANQAIEDAFNARGAIRAGALDVALEMRTTFTSKQDAVQSAIDELERLGIGTGESSAIQRELFVKYNILSEAELERADLDASIEEALQAGDITGRDAAELDIALRLNVPTEDIQAQFQEALDFSDLLAVDPSDQFDEFFAGIPTAASLAAEETGTSVDAIATGIAEKIPTATETAVESIGAIPAAIVEADKASTAPLASMGAKFITMGGQADTAASKVRRIQSAINALRSRTITVRTVVEDGEERKAHGGPVTAGRPYIVGEQGEELFVPGSDGIIIPAPRTRSLLSGASGGAASGGGNVFNINVMLDAPMGLVDPLAMEQLAVSLAPAIVSEIEATHA